MENDKELIRQIKALTRIGIALSAEKDINNFFKMVLEEAMNFTNADGGTIYTLSVDKQTLDFTIICTKSKNLNLGMADAAKWPSISLYDEKSNKIFTNFASYVAHTGKPCSVVDAYHQDMFDNSGTRNYDINNNYHSKSMIAIPMKDHENELLGVIQLINAYDDEGNITHFTEEHLTMLNSLSSQAAIAFTNKNLVKGLEKLLYQFVKSIATAIDRKSKYTGGHIKRVASLSEMLAEEIQKDSNKYKDIHFTPDEMQEISLAGWMHDVGKITTPIYIRDKAKKLETIQDRIEHVKTRFEFISALILKDIELAKTKQRKKDLQKLYEKLIYDRKFVINVNTGSEFMQDEYVNRIEDIYNFKYSANNKEYHLLTEDEKKNLCIRKGTLLSKELEKIWEHALVSHEMLSELSYPKKFRNLPLYAASHHEKLNGKGYPLKKTAEELPLQSRIIAIADLFEALSAYDRPYKKGKTLTETLTIMATMINNGEIDEDLVNLLIDSKLYLKYAEKFLKPEQIDDVDINKIKEIYKK